MRKQMAAAAVIGRVGGGEDTELELLYLQLAEQRKARDDEERHRREKCGTFPRNLRKRKSLWDSVQQESARGRQTRAMLASIASWDFNAFIFDRLTGGDNLPTLCTHLLRRGTGGGVLHHLGGEMAARKFFALVERGYRPDNPYHNGVHAADVTQAMHCFLRESPLRVSLTPIEYAAALVAAVCHDLDHPGFNEKFLVAACGSGGDSPLAALYGGCGSVLENHHWRSAVSALHESGVAAAMSAADLRRLKHVVREMILATDIGRQQEFLEEMRARSERGELDASIASEEGRVFLLQMALKCADISNPCRTWNVSRLWSHRACEEFFRQGDRERELKMPLTPICDRFNITVAKVRRNRSVADFKI